MIGPEMAGKGGIASVVSVLANDGFLQRNEIRYLTSYVSGGPLTKLFVALRCVLTFVWICIWNRPKIVHVHSASRASFVRKSLMLGIARTFSCKTIFHLHGGEFQQFATQEAGLMMRWWIRRTLSKSSKVIALSESWAAFIARFAEGVSTAVVVNSVKLADAVDPLREEPGRLLFLGRAEKHKGIFELLTAVSLLKESFPNIKLAIGGDGDLDFIRGRANELGISEFIEILGWVGPDEKAAQFARASVFTLPSYDEGLPMAMLEAMAAQKAIVVTPVGGIPEAVEDGVNGLLVLPRDAQALAQALRQLLEAPSLRTKLAENARKTIEMRYSTHVVIAKLSAIYQELGQA